MTALGESGFDFDHVLFVAPFTGLALHLTEVAVDPAHPSGADFDPS
jgi:hypothetical protein